MNINGQYSRSTSSKIFSQDANVLSVYIVQRFLFKFDEKYSFKKGMHNKYKITLFLKSSFLSYLNLYYKLRKYFCLNTVKTENGWILVVLLFFFSEVEMSLYGFGDEL